MSTDEGPAEKGPEDRFKHATFGIGADEDAVRQAEAEGRLSGPHYAGGKPPLKPLPPDSKGAPPKRKSRG
jgi:hypothetical protein